MRFYMPLVAMALCGFSGVIFAENRMPTQEELIIKVRPQMPPGVELVKVEMVDVKTQNTPPMTMLNGKLSVHGKIKETLYRSQGTQDGKTRLMVAHAQGEPVVLEATLIAVYTDSTLGPPQEQVHVVLIPTGMLAAKPLSFYQSGSYVISEADASQSTTGQAASTQPKASGAEMNAHDAQALKDYFANYSRAPSSKENRQTKKIKTVDEYFELAKQIEAEGGFKVFQRMDKEVVRPLRSIADNHTKNKEYDEAIAVYKQLYEFEKRFRGEYDHNTRYCLNKLDYLYRKTNQTADLVEVNEQKLAADQKKLGDSDPRSLNTMSQLAFAYKEKRAYSKSEELYKKLIRIHEENNQVTGHTYSKALYDIATLYIEMGDMVEAEPYYRKSLLVKHGPKADINNVLASDPTYAGILMYSGRYAEAEDIYQRQLAELEQRLGKDDIQVAFAQSNLAGIYNHLGVYNKALELEQSAYKTCAKVYGENNIFTAILMSSQADIWLSLKEYDKAKQLSEKAVNILTHQPPRQPNQPYVPWHLPMLSLAIIYTRGHEYDKAEKLFLNVIDDVSKESVEHHGIIAMARLYLAELYVLKEDPKAKHLAIQSLTLSIDKRVPYLQAKAYFLLGKIAHRQQQSEVAIFYGKQAINVLQGLRQGLAHSDKSLQQGFVESHQENYETLAGWLIDAGRLAEAEQVLAMIKQEEYFNYIRRSSKNDPRGRIAQNPVEAKLAAALTKTTQALSTTSRELSELKQMDASVLTDADKKRIPQLELNMQMHEKEFQAALVEVVNQLKTSGDHKLSQQLETQTYNQLHKQLDVGTALVHYLPLQDGLRILVRSKTSNVARKVAVKPAELNAQITAHRLRLKNTATDSKLLQQSAQQLYQWLIKPIEQDLQSAQTKTLLLYKNGSMRYIPLASLHDGNQYLIEKYAIANYNPVVQVSGESKDKPQWQIAGLGSSRSHKDLKALTMVPYELDNIIKESATDAKGIFSGKVFLDDNFTPAQFQKAITGNYQVGHVATHYQFKPGSETDSYLLAGDGTELTLASIRTADYEIKNIELLTLSACETAVVDVLSDGREIDGLASVMQSKGARGVMATLWPVADCSTGLLMERFYRYRQQGMSKAGALRQSQLDFITGKVPYMQDTEDGKGCQARPNKSPEKFAKPFYWAPFILMGDWQ